MTPKKKIIFLITKTVFGGAQRYVYDLATNLPAERFEVAVAVGGTGLLTEKLTRDGVRILPIPGLQRDISLLKEFLALFALYKIFRNEKPDIVHLNSSKAGVIGALAARLAGGSRIIFTAHGWPFREKRNMLWILVAWFGSWVTAFLSHTVIAVSEADRHNSPLPQKTVRIYNGIRPLRLIPADIVRQAFPNGTHITGTVGELNNNKNQIALLEEARQKPDMYVAIVGEGEKRKFLEQKIDEYKLGNRVKLFGFMPAESVLKGFDVFALPSLKEGLPYALLEAKAAGLPLVANRVGGVGEILDSTNPDDFSLDRMVRKTTELYF